MIKIHTVLYFCAVMLFLQVLSGCGKRGCMDIDGENYEPKATKDCGCCYYFGKVNIWYNYDYFQTKISGKITSFQIYVDGKLFKKTKQPDSFTSSRSEDTYSLSSRNDDFGVFELDLGNSKQKSFLITIADQNNATLYNGIINVKGNKIVNIQVN